MMQFDKNTIPYQFINIGKGISSDSVMKNAIYYFQIILAYPCFFQIDFFLHTYIITQITIVDER